MAFHRTINRIDHIQGASCRAAVLDVPGFDVEREEFRRQTAFLHTFDARAIWSRGSSTEIEIVVGHRGGHVVMRVNDDRAPVDL
jgi:hypothetical protein